jgi:hypothetical protein
VEVTLPDGLQFGLPFRGFVFRGAFLPSGRVVGSFRPKGVAVGRP